MKVFNSVLMTKKVVIVGGGFGGLEAALRLKDLDSNLKITLISKDRWLEYKPSFQHLVCNRKKLSKSAIRLDKLMKRKGIRFYAEEVIQVRPLEQAISTMTRKINFDYLIWAVGSVSDDRKIDGISVNALKLNNGRDVFKIRKELFSELSKARHYNDKIRIAVCGAGTTGVQLAADLSEKVGNKGSVVLIECGDRILRGFDLETSKYASKVLKKKSIDIV